VSWSRAGDGETNATWLSISEASRKDNAVVFHVNIAPLSAPWARGPQRANRPLSVVLERPWDPELERNLALGPLGVTGS
jgi:hypothetical protein